MQTLTATDSSLDAEASETNVKEKIQDKEGISLGLHEISAGTQAADDRGLTENIQKEPTMQVKLRLTFEGKRLEDGRTLLDVLRMRVCMQVIVQMTGKTINLVKYNVRAKV